MNKDKKIDINTKETGNDKNSIYLNIDGLNELIVKIKKINEFGTWIKTTLIPYIINIEEKYNNPINREIIILDKKIELKKLEIKEKELNIKNNTLKCEYCNKIFDNLTKLNRHEKNNCKTKRQQIINIIQNNNNCNNTINYNFIQKNYTKAYDFVECINQELSEKTKKEICKLYAVNASAKIIKTTCIDNINIDKRPIHCLDKSRNKYIYRDNGEWNYDIGGNYILDQTIPITKSILNKNIQEELQENQKNGIYENDYILIKINDLIKLENKNRKYILPLINNLITPKNNKLL